MSPPPYHVSRQQIATTAVLAGVSILSLVWFLSSRRRAKEIRDTKPSRRLHIIHFNDVYDVNPRKSEPVGGATRFATLVKETNEEMCSNRGLVLFSGDALNPSIASQVTRGAHMVPVLNAIGVHAACLGNHDLDCGLERFEELRPLFDFPWLACNVLEKNPDGNSPKFTPTTQIPDFQNGTAAASSSATNKQTKQQPTSLHRGSWDTLFAKPKRGISRRNSMRLENDDEWQHKTNSSRKMGGCLDHVMFDWPVDDEGTRIRVGVFGVVEPEWLETLNIDIDWFEVVDPITASRLQVKQLQNKGAEIIIALSHMRLPNDVKLAEQVAGLHLVLGGHDHSKVIRSYHSIDGANACTVVKSGSDFRCLSAITVELGASGHPIITAEHLECESEIFEDPTVLGIIEELNQQLAASGNRVIGRTHVDLDGRFETVRTQETNLGNCVADVMRSSFENADVALLNSGTIRNDSIIPRGDFTVAHLNAVLPFVDHLCLVELSGKHLLEVLNNGLSKYPALEGRFLQVSGMSFEFDPERSENDRIVRAFVKGAPISNDTIYKVVVKEYMLRGKDGFEIFKTAKVLVGPEIGPVLNTQFRNYLETQKPNRRLSRASIDQVPAEFEIAPRVENRIVCLKSKIAQNLPL